MTIERFYVGRHNLNVAGFDKLAIVAFTNLMSTRYIEGVCFGFHCSLSKSVHGFGQWLGFVVPVHSAFVLQEFARVII